MEGQPTATTPTDAAPVADTAAPAEVNSAPEATPAPSAPSDQATPVAPAESSAPETVEDSAATDKPSRRQREDAQRLRAEREQREAAELDRRVQEALERRERDQRAAAEQEKAQREHRERIGKYVGDVPADPANPNGPTLYDRLRADAMRVVQPPDQYATQDEWDAFNKAISEQNAAKTRLAEMDERRAMFSEYREPLARTARQQAEADVLGRIGRGFEAAISEAGADVEAVLRAGAAVPDVEARVPAMLKTFAEQIAAPLNAKVAELTEDLSVRDAEIDTLKKQLGGALPQPERGGVLATSGGPRTRAEFLALPIETRKKLRAEQPGLVNDIYSRSA